MGTNKEIHLLDDEPTSIDAFGSHNKVAKILKDVILEHNNGKAITMLGEWGSGKSSVIKILKNIINTNEEIFLIHFDAWAHRDDPLRRSVLEKLIYSFIETENKLWKIDDKWKGLISYLSGKVIKRKSTIKPRITVIGLFLTLYILLSPVTFTVRDRWPILDYIQIALLLLPIIYVIGRLAEIHDDKVNNRKSNEDIFEEKSELFSPFATNSTTTTNEESEIVNNITTIDFNKHFYNLLNAAIKNDNQKLIFVIDNLDRLEPETAKKVWATMNSFFEDDLSLQKKLKNKLWLIVPLSQDGIKLIWKDQPSDSFINKTFQVSINIPKPILSDWMLYFKSKIKEAFNDNLSEEEIHSVFHIYRRKVFPHINTPTPREIIIFINKFIVLYLLHCPEVSVKHITLYLSIVSSIESEDNIIALTLDYKEKNSHPISPLTEEFLEKGWKESIISIYYGVNKNKSFEILFSKTFEDTINKDDVDELQKLVSFSSFTRELGDYIEKNATIWLRHETSNFFKVANLLSQIEIDKDQFYQNAIMSLINNAKSFDKLDQLDNSVTLGIIELLKYDNSNDFIVRVIKCLSNSPELFVDDLKTNINDNVLLYLNNLSSIFVSIIEADKKELIEKYFYLKIDGLYLLKILDLLNSIPEHSDFYKLIKIENSKSLVQAIQNSINNGSFNDSYVNYIINFSKNDEYISFIDIIASIQLRMENFDLITSKELEANILLFYKLINKSEEIDNIIRKFTKKHLIFHHYEPLSSGLSQSFKKRLLFIYLNFDYKFTFPNRGRAISGLNLFKNEINRLSEDQDFKNSIYENLNRFSLKTVFIDILNNENSTLYLLVKKLVYFILAEKLNNEVFSSLEFYDNEDLIYNLLNDSEIYGIVCKQYFFKTNLLEIITSKEFDPQKSTLYIEAINCNKEIEKYLVENIQKLEKLDYLNYLDKDWDTIFVLIAKLTNNKVDLRLEEEYYEAIKEIITKYLDDEKITQTIIDNWQQLIYALNSSYQLVILRNQLDNIIREDDSNKLSKIISLFKPSLFTKDVLHDISDDLMRIGLENALNLKLNEILNWYIEILQTNEYIIELSKQSTLRVLKSKITKLLKKDLEDEFKTKITQLQELLNS